MQLEGLLLLVYLTLELALLLSVSPNVWNESATNLQGGHLFMLDE